MGEIEPVIMHKAELLENWTLASLKEELNKKVVRFPKNARMALVRLLQHNTGENEVSTQRNDDSSTRGQVDIYSSARSHDSSQNAHGDESVFGSEVSQDAPMINNNNNNGDTSNNRVLIGLVSKLSSTVQTLQQNESSLTSKVNTLIAERPELPGKARAVELVVNRTTINLDQNSTARSTQFNLETAYNALRRPVPSAAAGSEEQLATLGMGFAVESLPFVETVSPQLMKNIIRGMDINLASLLIPYYSGSGVMETDYLGVDN